MPATQWNGEWHPFAQRFPLLNEEDLLVLGQSIRENGQIAACLMTPDGLGLSGRNRVAACQAVRMEPRWVITEARPGAVILAENVFRRHLSTGQQAMAVAIDLLDLGKRQPNGRWARGSIPEPLEEPTLTQAAWTKQMAHAGIVLDWLPDGADEVLAGTMSMDAAWQRAEQERSESEHLDRLAEIDARRREALPEDLRNDVDAGGMSVDEAESFVRDREIVDRVDTLRELDGQPAFRERVETGDMSWSEAASLASQWEMERDLNIVRFARRLVSVVELWPQVLQLLPGPPYAAGSFSAAAMERLGEEERKVLLGIVAAVAAADRQQDPQ